MTEEWLELEIRDARPGAENIRLYELVHPAGAALPTFTAGAHVKVRVGDEIRHYSLANDPAERSRYLLGVLKDPKSRGGSQRIHETWTAGQRISVSQPINHFPLAAAAQRHVLIAGGIGITPIIAMAQQLGAGSVPYALYYCAREEGNAAFLPELRTIVAPQNLHLVFDGGDPTRGLDLAALLGTFEPGRHVYVCGPMGLIQAVRNAAAHWPADHVHFEIFAAATPVAPATSGSFTVELAKSGGVYEIPPEYSILDVLEAKGLKPQALCREGYCGTCLVTVLEGVPDHRDSILDDAEKAAGDVMALCCSRAKSGKLVLDI